MKITLEQLTEEIAMIEQCLKFMTDKSPRARSRFIQYLSLWASDPANAPTQLAEHAKTEAAK